MPAGLGGDVAIKLSSCARCQHITSGFETKTIDQFMNIARRHAGVNGRKQGKRNKPRVRLIVDRENQSDLINPPIHDIPTYLMLFKPKTPEALLGLPPPKGFQKTMGQWWVYLDPAQKEKLTALGLERQKVAYQKRLYWEPFASMIAKIAHVYAVAELGLNGFTPLLPALIMHTPERLSPYLVGGILEDTPPSAALHEVGLFRQRVEYGQGLLLHVEEFWVARVRLFANLGAPNYLAVVGKPL